ncbi:hypothetical protein [Corynebacterium bovis]|uniref:hypothetical protein n=1 Tax=Corynebacterium bovis TaxID=36808 RepID=UPI003139CAD0
MDDPTRIPAVTRLLRMAWEAQPGLTLPQVFGLLEARGIGWGSTDGEVRAALTGLLDEHPYQLRGHSAAVSATDVPAADVPAATDATGAAATAPPQPVAWRYRRIRACRAGEPLVVTDAEGIDHRLGLVARISVIDHTATPLTDLTGLRRDALADRTFLIVFDDGSTALVDRSLWVYEVGRRDISHRRLRWRRLSSAAVGAPLVVQQQGAAPATLGTVAEIVRLA